MEPAICTLGMLYTRIVHMDTCSKNAMLTLDIILQVEIRYLFRYPVSRSVHARFLHKVPKTLKRVDVGYLSFHTSPNPTVEDKALFETRRSTLRERLSQRGHANKLTEELLEWRENGGCPPRSTHYQPPNRPPKAR